VDRAAAFDVVAQFEEALSEYTGAPYVVTTDSCTNALYLCLKWSLPYPYAKVTLPKRTYIGVAQAAVNAGYEIEWKDEQWKGYYLLGGTNIIDAAKCFRQGMYRGVSGLLHCLSFQAGKGLPIGRGGAVLTDDKECADWLRRARLDGRTAGADYADNTYQTFGAHCYMTPPDAARGLWLLTYIDDGLDNTWESYPDISEATWT
jgi:dTDP-4-amino-4,6-dideoxygalactose transaminase